MEIFQQKQNEMLHGLTGIESMADDILMYDRCCNKEEATHDHNKNLEQLLQRLRKYGLKLNDKNRNFA